MASRPQSVGRGYNAARGSCVRATKSRGSSHTVREEEQDSAKGMSNWAFFFGLSLCGLSFNNDSVLPELVKIAICVFQLFNVGQALSAALIPATIRLATVNRNYSDILTLTCLDNTTAVLPHERVGVRT